MSRQSVRWRYLNRPRSSPDDEMGGNVAISQKDLANAGNVPPVTKGRPLSIQGTEDSPSFVWCGGQPVVGRGGREMCGQRWSSMSDDPQKQIREG